MAFYRQRSAWTRYRQGPRPQVALRASTQKSQAAAAKLSPPLVGIFEALGERIGKFVDVGEL